MKGIHVNRDYSLGDQADAKICKYDEGKMYHSGSGMGKVLVSKVLALNLMRICRGGSIKLPEDHDPYFKKFLSKKKKIFFCAYKMC